jgi:hypothetical protein
LTLSQELKYGATGLKVMYVHPLLLLTAWFM